MKKRTMSLEQVRQFLEEAACDRLSSGSFQETVEIAPGRLVTFEFSLATGMAWTAKKTIYTSRFGDLPNWVLSLHPIHRTRLCTLSIDHRQSLPEAVNLTTIENYLSSRMKKYVETIDTVIVERKRPTSNTSYMTELLDFEEIKKYLINDAHVRSRILRKFKKDARLIMESVLKGQDFDLPGLYVNSFLNDLLHNDARLYKRFTARGSFGNYHIDIKGLGGVYFYWAPDFGSTGYFISIDEASTLIVSNWADNLVSFSGRVYRKPFNSQTLAQD